ncbi:MAG: hypothetical protein HZB16_06450 [Armatimonadetes bacterium]|nr:hypothetical protein [Armatimonadota bacterium]
MHGEQRFVDRQGWLRNRRAVVLDERGITVERWLGPPTSIAWGDLAGARWHGAHTLELITMGSSVSLDRGVVGLSQLARAVHERVTGQAEEDAAGGALADDVARWLGGFTSAVHRPALDLHEGGLVALAGALGLGLVGSLALWWLALGYGPPSGGSTWAWIAWLLVVLLTAKLIAAVTWLSTRRLTALGPAACRVTADSERVTIHPAGGQPDSFAWHEVIGLVEWSDGCRIHLSDGRDLTMPNRPQFEPVLNALRHLARRREGFDAEHLPVPASALSPAGQRWTEAHRGLSPADAEQETLDA